MAHFPLARVLATTTVSWLLISGAHAQAPAGRSRAEVEAEAVAVARAPTQNVTSDSRMDSKVISTMPQRTTADSAATAAK